MTDLLPLLAAERRGMADLLDDLDRTELARPSLCAGWTVRDVFAHLTLSVDPSRRRQASALVRSGMRPPRFIQLLTAEAARRTDAELAALLRTRAERRWSPPGFGLEAPLTDVLVHGVDVRLPLGRSHSPDPVALRTALDLATSRKAGIGGFFIKRSTQQGLRFEASDLDWSHGDGPTVRGPALPLLVALGGRPAVLSQLDGEGLHVLRGRLV